MLFLQINAFGTLLASVFPAFLPRCHRYIEEGSRLIKGNYHENLLLVSPDGVVKCNGNCNGNCVNKLRVPTGNLALEIKCPFSPIANKMLLPVNYVCPYYYACQLLSEMKVLQSNIAMVVSCSPESLTMSYLDWNEQLWTGLWSRVCELYDVENCLMPTSLDGRSKTIRNVLTQFIEDNSTVAVEVPTLECIDSKAYEKCQNDENPVYRYRDKYPPYQIDKDEVKERVLNCCKSTVEAIREAHDLERRKANEVLLFLLTDTDRSFQKDKPAAIPVAYALKGRSLKVSTALKMVNDVWNFLKEHDINVLVESYDGQWARLVFRDRNNNPLTLFELQRDCWLKFSNMSKGRFHMQNLICYN